MNSLKSSRIFTAAVCMLLFSVLILPSSLSAQESAPLRITPDEAFRMALENSRDVWSSMTAMDQAGKAYRWRYLQLLPELKIEGALESRQTDATDWAGGAGAGVSLVMQAEDLVSLEEKRVKNQQQQAAFRKTTVDFKAEVYTSYFDLVLQREEITLRKRQLQSASDRLEAARFDYDNGRISEYEYLSAQLSYEETAPVLKGKQIGYESAIKRFLLLIGADTGQEIELTGDLMTAGLFDSAEELPGVLRKTPLIEQLSAVLRSREVALKKVPLKFLPDLSLSLSRSFSTNIPAGTSSDTSDGNYSLSIVFNLNDLLPGSQFQTEREAALTSIEDARRQLENNVEEQEVLLQELLAGIEKSAADIEAARFKKELSDRFFSIAESEYENGRRDLLDLEDADLKRGEAQLGLLSAVYQRMNLLIELEKLTGMDLIE